MGVRRVWSSRNQKFIDHCMTHKEFSSLCDVYKTIDPEFHQKKTSYVLQTLWQDLTSEVDITNMVFYFNLHFMTTHEYNWPSLHK